MTATRASMMTASAAAFLAAGALWLSPAALAAPAVPAAPTVCSNIVSLEAALSIAQDALSGLSATAPAADRDAAQGEVDTAAAAVRVCRTQGTTTTTTTTPTTTTTAPSESKVDDLIDDIRVLRCGANFQRDYGRLRDRQFALIGSTTSAEQGRIADALNARLKTLGYCNGTVVDPGADDGSRADTDGSQVKVVPDGSANTGEA